MNDALERYAELADDANDIFFTHDLAGRVTRVNRAARLITGYTDEEALRLNLYEIIAPDCRDFARQMIERQIDGAPSAMLELALIAKDGGRVWVELTTRLIWEQGRVVGVQGVARDITRRVRTEIELQASQGRFRAISDASPLGILVTDPHGDCTYTNRFWQELTGLSPEQALGRGWVDIIHAEDRERVVREWYEAAAAERSYESVHRWRSLHGKVTWVSVKAAAVRDGAIRLGYVATIEDITARKQAEDQVMAYTCELEAARTRLEEQSEELARARDAALSASSLKSEFLAAMSHEVRTPMNGIVGMTDLLLATRLNAEQRDLAETVRDSGRMLRRIIDDILDFSKIEAGRLDLESVEFSAREAIEDVLELLSGRAEEKGLDLACLVGRAVPLKLQGDPLRLRQVLINLVGNAVKFTDRGEVFVEADLAGESAEWTEIRFTVTDTGVGLEPDAQPRLFEPFWQGDSVSRRYGGTGLGLAISRQLVERMNGQIGAASKPGEGARFWFTARFDKSREPAVLAREVVTRRVLVASARSRTLSVVASMCRELGLEVEEANSGEEVLRVVAASHTHQRPFETVLVESGIGGENDVRFASSLRARGATGSRVVLLVPFSRIGKLAESANGRIDEYLTTPVRMEGLLRLFGPPIEAGVATGPPPGPPPAEAPPVCATGAMPLSVLIAEDNPVNQKVALRLVEKLGYRAEIAANGRAALQALERGEYAAVLMDCQMPELDGFAATTELRRREDGRRRTPVIAMTAGAMGGDRERCLEAGMDDYIAKPVSLDDLAVVLERWTGAKASMAKQA